MNEQTKVYLVRAGRIGEDEENALEEGLAIIGFLEYPSLQGMRDYASVAKLVHDTTPGSKPRANGNRAGQLWAFAVSMKEGDVVVLPRKLTSQVALGRVTGPYQYRKIGNEFRHTRPVEWIRPDVPRNTFAQDLLGSFGAFMTVCNISRNDAEQRIMAVLNGKADPGFSGDSAAVEVPAAPPGTEPASATDFAELSNDQIVAHIQSRFHGHALAGLVDAVLRADGWVTKLSPPGPDGGVDILAGRGSLGLDPPRLCVQVKSQATPCDVTVFRTLQGSMQSFKAEQGLLVCWGGFNSARQPRIGPMPERRLPIDDLIDAYVRMRRCGTVDRRWLAQTRETLCKQMLPPGSKSGLSPNKWRDSTPES